MFDNLFGAEMPLAVRFFLAFLIVLGLIGGAAWAVRRFGTGRLGGANARGRQPRLAVIDYASVDGRRRLILVRRDNVEHLLMIGGPTDVVVEPNIVRAVAAPRDVPVLRAGSGLDTLPRAIPLPENGSNGNGWPLQPEPVAALRPSPRVEPLPDEAPARPFPSPGETPSRPQRDTLAALADELSTRPTPPPRPRAATPARTPVPEPRPNARQETRQETRQEAPPEPPAELEAAAEEPRLEPRPEPRQPPAQPAAVAAAPAAPIAMPASAEAAAADQSLADMAQRLEAALRKSNTPPAMPSRPVSTAPERTQPANAAPPPRAPRPSEPRPPRADAKPNQGKSALYDNLEQEMASLLGRPPKT
jgi:hypothetical protein